MTMLDKYGKELRTGDLVRVSNAYFKSANGLFFVRHSPGDPDWSGDDFSLRRIKKNGELTDGPKKVEFWPLKSYCSDSTKNALAREWNEKNAEIEIITSGISRKFVGKHFAEKADNTYHYMTDARWNWGKHSAEYLRNKRIRDHYLEVAEFCNLEG